MKRSASFSIKLIVAGVLAATPLLFLILTLTHKNDEEYIAVKRLKDYSTATESDGKTYHVPLDSGKEPMVMSLSYWEQSGSALASLFDIQCWAHSVNITKVVEPAIISNQGSVLQFQYPQEIPFSDCYDLEHWNNVSSSQRRSVLIPQSKFFKESLRNVVHVQLQFQHSKCEPIKVISQRPWYKMFTKSGFSITTVCVPVNTATSILREKIFGTEVSLAPDKSVLFDEWRGISSSRPFRLLLKGTKCVGGLSYIRTQQFRAPISTVLFSKKILSHYKSFLLSKNLLGKPYVVVLIRTERLHDTVLSSKHKTKICLQEMMSDYHKMADSLNTSTVLVFTDSGPHGSATGRDIGVRKEFSEEVVRRIKPLIKLESIGETLTKLTHSSDPVLLTLIESTVASNSEGLLLVGGGSFQMMTLNKYMENRQYNNLHYKFREYDCQYIPNFNDPKYM